MLPGCDPALGPIPPLASAHTQPATLAGVQIQRSTEQTGPGAIAACAPGTHPGATCGHPATDLAPHPDTVYSLLYPVTRPPDPVRRLAPRMRRPQRTCAGRLKTKASLGAVARAYGASAIGGVATLTGRNGHVVTLRGVSFPKRAPPSSETP